MQTYTPFGRLCSKAQGSMGERLVVEGVVILQDDYPIDTPAGRKYSHIAVIADKLGNLYHYKGSKFFPKHSAVAFTATVKGYKRGEPWGSIMTVLAAPKCI